MVDLEELGVCEDEGVTVVGEVFGVLINEGGGVDGGRGVFGGVVDVEEVTIVGLEREGVKGCVDDD